MTAKELYELIESLASDIEFDYHGMHGSICPFSRNDIAISYGSVERTHESIEAAMNDKIYSGRCLNEIAGEIEIY